MSINTVHSNGFVVASQSIELVNINGGSNEFIICASGNNKFSKTIQKLQKAIKIFNTQYTKTKLQKLKDKYNLYITKATQLKKIILTTKQIKEIVTQKNNLWNIFCN